MTQGPPPGSWESAPLPPGLPPGHEPGDGGEGFAAPDGGKLVPWEDPTQGGEIERFVQTVRGLLLEPVATFDRVGNSEALGRPIAFGMILSTLAQLASASYQAAFGSLAVLLGSLGTGASGPRPSPFGSVSETAVQFAMALVMPIFFVVMMVIGAGITHVCLMMFGGANRSFNQTMRVLCYATATNVLALVPFLGAIVAAAWSVVLHVIGLARAHRTTYGRSALAVLTPSFLCCACALVALVAFAGAIFAALRP